MFLSVLLDISLVYSIFPMTHEVKVIIEARRAKCQIKTGEIRYNDAVAPSCYGDTVGGSSSSGSRATPLPRVGVRACKKMQSRD